MSCWPLKFFLSSLQLHKTKIIFIHPFSIIFHLFSLQHLLQLIDQNHWVDHQPTFLIEARNQYHLLNQFLYSHILHYGIRITQLYAQEQHLFPDLLFIDKLQHCLVREDVVKHFCCHS